MSSELTGASITSMLIAMLSISEVENKEVWIIAVPIIVTALSMAIFYFAAMMNFKSLSEWQADNQIERHKKRCNDILSNPHSSEQTKNEAKKRLDRAYLASMNLIEEEAKKNKR